MRAPLTTSANLFDFFHDKVDTAVHARRTEVSEEGVFYLSNLLVERGRCPADAAPDTLAELHIAARGAGPVGAIRAWRELGDSALHTSGFFRGSLARRLVSLDYYLEMGASAYARLARLLRASGGRGGEGGHKAFDAVFEELATTFADCSEVLSDVRTAVRAEGDDCQPEAIVELYEEWLATGNAAAARRLGQLGLLVGEDGGEAA